MLRADALRNQIYGTYGISVFAVRGTTLDDMAREPPLVRFQRLTLVTAGVVRAAGLRLEPTGRNPRHFDIAFDVLDDGVARLCAASIGSSSTPTMNDDAVSSEGGHGNGHRS